MSNVGSIFTGNVGASGLNRSGNVGRAYFDTYTYSLLFNSLLTGFSEILTTLGATYTRAGTKYNLQNGLYVAYGANAFGTNYDVSEATYGYYPETAATNIITYSSDLTNAVWTKGLTTPVTTSSDAPISGGTSYFAQTRLLNTLHSFYHSTLVASGTLSTVSYIVKANGYRYVSIGRVTAASTVQTWVFDLQDGDIFQTPTSPDYTNGKIVSLGGGWYRISVNVNSTTAAVRQPRLFILSNTPTTPVTNDNSDFSADGVGGVLYWNGQYETGGRASSPIVTTSSTVTRAADVLSVPRANLTKMSDSRYTLIADYRADIPPGPGGYVLSLTDVVSDNVAHMYNANFNGFIVASGGIVQYDKSVANSTATRTKAGMSLKTGTMLSSQNGVALDASVGSPTMPISPTSLDIGHILSIGHINGHIFSVKIITSAISQTELDMETTL